VLDARFEAAQTWAARLDNPEHWYDALSQLASITLGSSSGGGHSIADRETILALRKRWNAFLQKNERDIRKGRVFKPGDPELPEDLFSPHMELDQKDGTRWPPQKK
jgi:hypothetical protein